MSFSNGLGELGLGELGLGEMGGHHDRSYRLTKLYRPPLLKTLHDSHT